MADLELVGESTKAEYQPLAEKAKEAAVGIVDSFTFEAAASLYQAVRAAIKDVGGKLDPFVQDAHSSWKKAIARRQVYLDPLEAAEAALKPAIARYQVEQERIRQAEQRRLEEEARKQAEEAQIAEAQAAADAGEKEVAEQIISAPTIVAPVFTPVSTPKVSGLSFRDNWSAQVIDVKALLKAVIEGKVPYAAIKADESWLNSQAKQLKAEMNYPGVRVTRTSIPVSR